MSENKSFFKSAMSGALSLTISAIIVKIIGLIYKVPLSYILSDEGMGYFNSAYTVYTFFYIISTAGIPKAISIMTAHAESECDDLKVRYIYKMAFKIFLFFGLATTVIFMLVAKPMSVLIGNSGSYRTMLAIAPSIIFVCLAGVLRGYFNGRFKLLPVAISELISGVSKLAIGLALAMMGYKMNLNFTSISALSILGLTLGSFFGFLYLWVCKKSEKDSGFNDKILFKNYKFPNVTKEIIKIAVPITVTSSIASIGGIIDLAIIMNRLGDAGYTELQSGILYGNYTTLALPMFNLIGTVVAPFSAIILPLVSREGFLENKANYSDKLTTFFKVLSFLIIPVSFVFCFFPNIILSIIFEDSSAIMSAPLLQLLSPAVITMSYLTIVNTILEGVGKTKVPLLSLLIGMMVKLIISYLLIGKGDIGIFGAPISTSLSYLVSFMVSYYYLCVKLKIHLDLSKSFLPLLFSAIISFLPGVLMTEKFSLSNIESFLIIITVNLVYALIILFIFNLFGIKNMKKTANCTKK